MAPLYKGTPSHVRLEDTTTHDLSYVTREAAEWLHEHGQAHPGEDRWTLADGVTWLDVERVLTAVGFSV